MTYKMFGDIVCGKTLGQMHEVMKHPMVLKGAMMPDAHAGYVLPIGGVVLTKVGTIFPSFVGYDIGCGMTAAKLNVLSISKANLEIIRDRILEEIPMGNNRHKSKSMTCSAGFTDLGKNIATSRGEGQLGTLGGGNHFIEMGQDDFGNIWICIHSGSRGVGHAIGTHYMKVAAEKAGVTNGNHEGPYPLTEDMIEYDAYVQDMKAAQQWSVLNRAMMLKKIIEIIRDVLPQNVELVGDPIVNNHNMAEISDAGTLHRKGATPAEAGQLGIIPGSMRDGFFVVEGVGNEESMCSASHGAGRVLSRGQAKKEVDFNQLVEEMSNVVTNISPASIDEAPAAYKSIFEVMESQKDCVTILMHVRPILNVKG